MFTILMVAFASLCFTACGDDDDEDDGGGSSIQNVLVGSWRTTWDWETSSAGTSGYEIYRFNADGTGTMSGSNQDYDRYGNKKGSPYTWNESFRYEVYEYDSYLKTGTMHITFSGYSNYSSKTFKLDGIYLTIDYYTYTKQ